MGQKNIAGNLNVNGNILHNGVEIDYNCTEYSSIDIQRVFRTEFAIETTITGGHVIGDSSLWTEETTTISIIPNDNCILPETIELSGANYSYNNLTGIISLDTPIANIFINILCPQVNELEAGDIIRFDAQGTGQQKRFKVIKVQQEITTLYALDNLTGPVSSGDHRIVFDNGQEGTQYKGSTVDEQLNNTYYNALTEEVRNAIVPTARVQSMWLYGDAQYKDNADFSQTTSSGSNIPIAYYHRVSQTDIGDRYCYLLDLDEIVDHFKDSQLPINYLEMKAWLENPGNMHFASACGNTGSSSFLSYTFRYWSTYNYLDNNYASLTANIRPVFRINLAGISYTKE